LILPTWGIVLGYLLFVVWLFCNQHAHAAPPLSAAGYQLILDYELGGGQKYYDRFLQHPEWPGVASGVTVGVGYDCRFNTAKAILNDWAALAETDRQRLAACAGLGGQSAKAKASELRDLTIPWAQAEEVFQERTLTRFYNLTRLTFPRFDRLPVQVQDALFSLTFNRGVSRYGASRRELRNIDDICATDGDARKIAAQIRAMKRLWPTVPGLLKRREAEARLCEG
jgi:hypothetical protein